MKYSAHTYAKALVEAFGSKEGDVSGKTRRFISLLKKNGDLKNLGKILYEAERLSLRKSGAKKVLIESARPLGEKVLSELKEGFGREDVIESKVNPELIAGAKIIIDGEWTIDSSLKGRLKKLFHQVNK